MKLWFNRKSGFTIIELIVVISVIAILATLVIVAYSSLSGNSRTNSLKTDLTSAAAKLKSYMSAYGSYPESLNADNCPTAPSTDLSYCLKFTSGNARYSYEGSKTYFSLGISEASNTSNCYRITPDSQPTNKCYAAENVLPQAAWWIDSVFSGASQTVTNLGTAGSVLNATLGSSTSSNSDDPTLLTYEGEPYIYLPGSGSNNISTPDSSQLDITGDIDIRVRVGLSDWSPAAFNELVSKWNATTNQRSYLLRINPTGNLVLFWSSDGIVDTNLRSSTENISSSADNKVQWVRATLDVDNGSGGHDVKFYTSNDGIGWNQLGSTITTAGTTSIFSGSAALIIGGRDGDTTNPLEGKIYNLIIKNGLDGNTVLNIDKSNLTSGSNSSFLATTGQTVTINRATSGRKSVVVYSSPLWIFGTDEYMEVVDNDLLDFGATDSFTLIMIAREWNTPTGYGGWLSKSGSNTGARWSFLQLNTNYSTYYAVTDTAAVNRNNATTALTSSEGVLQVRGAVMNRTNNSIQNILNGTLSSAEIFSTVGSAVNSYPLWVGRFQTAGNYLDAEVYAAAIFRSALSPTDISAISTYYLDRIK